MGRNMEYRGRVVTEVPEGLIIALMKPFKTANLGKKNKMLEVVPALRVVCHFKFASDFTSTPWVPRGYQPGLFPIKSQQEIELR